MLSNILYKVVIRNSQCFCQC